MSQYTIRRAEPVDAEVIAHHRVCMFRDMGQLEVPETGQALYDVSLPAITSALRDGSYVAWLAVAENGEVVAGAGAHLYPTFPRITPDGTDVVTLPLPMVLNVYTEPAWRSRGIARALMQTLMTWATDHGFDRVALHASSDGRALYESLGFAPTNEMRWVPRRS